MGGRWLRLAALVGEGGEDEEEVRGGVGGRCSASMFPGVDGEAVWRWCAALRRRTGTAGALLAAKDAASGGGGCSGVGGRWLGRRVIPAGTSGVGARGRLVPLAGRYVGGGGRYALGRRAGAVVGSGTTLGGG